MSITYKIFIKTLYQLWFSHTHFHQSQKTFLLALHTSNMLVKCTPYKTFATPGGVSRKASQEPENTLLNVSCLDPAVKRMKT